MGLEDWAAILCRVFDLTESEAGADAARAVLKFKFRRRDIARVNKLSALARAGKLSDAERDELDGYLLVGDLLVILHSKARMALRREMTPIPRRVRRKAS